MDSHLRQRGLDPAEHLITVKGSKNPWYISMEDIEQVIEQHGDEIAVILLGGVQYYTGQVFDMAHITELGHKKV